jgi:1-acyl-sn-glycerol-3-phosphate acyltransferase
MTSDRVQPTERQVAVIGIGCRFPGGADTPDRYWQLLRNGTDAITDIPIGRWDNAQLYDPDPARPGHLNVKRGGFLDDVAGFDASFFGMSPREAVHVDPQQRLLLEMAYESLEDAGIPLESIAGSPTGVFVGISTHDYGDIQMYPANRPLIDGRSNVGVATSLAANRISYMYDLRGPSMAVDTACSSSLTAAHLALASLRRGECSLALLGGIQLMLTPEVTIGFSKATMLSPDGRCAAFDAAANGYARSEGGAVLVLKPLDQALADGDRIYAIIGGTAINQDGRTTGMTVPSTDAQSDMLRAALADAGLEASDVDYIEAHGTGTPVGDPLEAAAIGAVFSAAQTAGRSLAIGSAKTNVGHLEAASGMAGLCKTILSLHHREIPASLHFTTPNPDIDFDGLRLRVVDALEPWPSEGVGVGVAGVNSFGFGGANAHVVLLEAPVSASGLVDPSPAAPQVLLVSARGSTALESNLHAHADSLINGVDDIAAYCRTAATRRAHHEHRVAAVADNADDLAELLTAIAAGERRAAAATNRASAESARIAFVFAGMGPQWWAMGRSLLENDKDFSDVIDQCDDALRALSPWSVREELLRDEPDSIVTRPDIAQVTNFAVQMGIVAVLRRFGVQPDAVIGHSAGEIAAACASGALSLADGAVLAWHRGYLQARASGMGRMLAVGLPKHHAVARLEKLSGPVALAAVNDRSSVTLSGDEDALAELAEQLQSEQIFARFLNVTVPYHSALMDPIESELRTALSFLAPVSTTVPMMSVVEPGWCTGTDLDADYWWRNVRQPVLFAEGIDALIADGYTTFLEIAPHPALAQSVTAALSAHDRAGAVIGTLRRNEDDQTNLLRSIAGLWTRGVAVDWAAVHGVGPDRTDLPRYRWDKEPLWFVSADEVVAAPVRGPWVHPLLGWRIPAAVPVWQADLGADSLAWLDDHLLRSSAVHPGAGYVEAFLAAGTQLGYENPVARSITLTRALVLTPRADVRVQCAIGDRGVAIHADTGGGWQEHATARIEDSRPLDTLIDLDAVSTQCTTVLAHDDIYASFARRGLEYGPAFTGITDARRTDGQAVARIELPAAAGPTDGYLVHPALLDATFQLLLLAADVADDGLFVPVHIDAVAVKQAIGRTCWAWARLISGAGNEVVGEVDLIADDGTVLMTVRGLRCQRLDDHRRPADGIADWLYELRWEAPEDGSGGPTILRTTADDSLAGVRESAAALAESQDWSSYYTLIEPALQRAAAGFIWNALLATGWNADNPEPRQTLIARLGAVPSRERHAETLISGLIEGGWLQSSDGSVAGASPPGDPDLVLADLVALDAAFSTDAALVGKSGAALDAVLRGETKGVEVLLDAEGSELLQHFYATAPASRFTNTLISDVVRALTVGRAGDRPLRVLEVGGGTGGTTAHLRRALPSDTQYTFTDVSPAFTQAMAANDPLIDTRVLDLEKPFDEQAIGSGYDLVVGANVVHATGNIGTTLQRLRDCLAPGGRVVLVEITRPLLWLDVVFGSADGWWLYDDDYRTTGALLSPDKWLEVLATEGFTDATVVSDSPADGIPGQSVLVATRPESIAALELPAAVGTWTVSGSGALADLVRERLESLGVLSTDGGVTGHLHIASQSRDFDGASSVLDACTELLGSLPANGERLPHGFWVVTDGAQQLGPDHAPQAPALAGLWGLTRVARKERQDIDWHLVDLVAIAGGDAVESLLHLVFDGTDEDEIALTPGGKLVRRLRRIAPPVREAVLADSAQGWRADVERPGALDTLKPRPVTRRAPEAGEVEVSIDAAALNFRDVMLASGLLPAMASEGTFANRLLGLDLAGTVVACGPDVTTHAVGDRVFGIGPGTFASYTTTSAELVAPIPSGVGMQDAAALPCAFVTSVYALETIARLSAGERVLIHAATGGVGLAAIQVAQALGAEIFATAGNDEKRALLRELGVQHVFDSRSLDFADGVLAATDGEGVDVVLNSLSGAAIPAGLRCLARYGRFVEIGKRDIYEDAALDMLQFRRNLSFSAVDLDLLCRERPAVAGSLLRTVAERFAAGSYTALPISTFPIGETAAAMRLLGQARHIGKVVLTIAGEAPLLDAANSAEPLFKRDASYLITGGNGGFGREIAAWLAEQGAGTIVLMSRTAPDASTLGSLADLCAPAQLVAMIGDVGVESDVQRVLDAIDSELSPLRGVVHAAMVLADGPLPELTADQLRTGLHAKVDGAWNLHRLTGDLDHFILFSSIASLLGNPLQGAYAAANSSMAALAHMRRASGRPAVAIDWGVLGEVGYVSQHRDVATFLDHQGYLAFTPAQAVTALAAAIADGRPQVMAARIDWRRWSAAAGREATSSRLIHFVPVMSGGAAGAVALAFESMASLTPQQRHDAVIDRLRQRIATLLGVSAARVDIERTLFDLGFDSLIAVELTVSLRADFGLELPVLQLLKDTTVRALADIIAAQAQSLPAQAQSVPAQTPGGYVAPDSSVSPALPVPEPAPEATPEPTIAIAGSAPKDSAPADGIDSIPAALAADIARYESLDYGSWNRAQRAIKGSVLRATRLTATVDIIGAEHLSTAGPYVLATNHLTLLDVPLVLSIMPRPTVIFAAPELRRYPWIHWVLSDLGNAIYVERGTGDLEAIEKGLAVLRAGGVLGLSPEGIRTPELTRAKTGMARLAIGANVPIVPLAIWGQDALGTRWRRGRRAEVHIRVGAPITAPSGSSTADLVAHTTAVMTSLAALLPERYRGAYAEEVEQLQAVSGKRA